MIKISDLAKYYKGLPHQDKALGMVDDLIKNSPLFQDDQAWVKTWRSPSPCQKINQAGLELLKRFEGCVLTAYDDGTGVLTIGYGHTQNVYPNQTITQQEAINLLDKDLQIFESGICQLVKVALNSNQFSALVCFAFNVGLEPFGHSTLLKLLNSGDYVGASNQFVRWAYVDGKILEGLLNRRNYERNLFIS